MSDTTPVGEVSATPIAYEGQDMSFQVKTDTPAQEVATQSPAQGADYAGGKTEAEIVAMFRRALSSEEKAEARAEVKEPAVQEPPSVEPKTESPVSDYSNYDTATIDDPIIRSMATMLKIVSKDMDVNRAFAKALDSGDASLIDVAYVTEKGGENAAHILEVAKGIVKAIDDKGKALTSEVHSIAGGQEQWAASAAVFNQSAPEHLKITIKQMLDSAKPELVKAGARIVAEFGRSTGQLPQVGKGLVSGATGVAGSGLSKAGFQTELAKLNPQSSHYEDQRAALFTRRQAGIRSGL